MSLLLREILNYNISDSSKYTQNFNFKEADDSSKIFSQESYGGFSDNNSDNIIEIEAMHFGVVTKNFTRYKRSAGQNSLESWTYPYQAPVIMYHNDYDGEMIGRVVKSEIRESTIVDGHDCLVLSTKTPEPDNFFKIKSGVYKTVSVGVEASDVRCSICGAQLAGEEQEGCDHIRGRVYDDKVCVWDIYAYEAVELSYVIVPSDPYAQVINIKNDSDINSTYSNQFLTKVTDSLDKKDDKDKDSLTLKEGANYTDMDLKEQLADVQGKLKNLELEKDVLKGDVDNLQESLNKANKDKLSLQQQVKELKSTIDAKEAEVNSEKQLKEAAETKIASLQQEVKLSLTESLFSLRKQANKTEIPVEKLNERSIDSLKDSINDLKEEIKEAEKKAALGSVKNPTVQEEKKDLDEKLTKLNESTKNKNDDEVDLDEIDIDEEFLEL